MSMPLPLQNFLRWKPYVGKSLFGSQISLGKLHMSHMCLLHAFYEENALAQVYILKCVDCVLKQQGIDQPYFARKDKKY